MPSAAENALRGPHRLVECYRPGDRLSRTETDRFRKFTYDELLARDKVSLDIFWLKDDSLEELDNLPDPATLAAEIVEDLCGPRGAARSLDRGMSSGHSCTTNC